MERTGKLAVWLLTLGGVLSVVAVVAATGLGVVARYFHIGGVTWSFELVGILFLWVTAFGAVLSEIRHENVSIDGVVATPGRIKGTYHAIVLLIVAGVMVWSGWAMLDRTAFTPTPVMRAPSWIMQATIPLMGVGLGLIALLRLFRLTR
ncbi:TRAP transporter small permease [Neotabrizicola sp. sgz301269]|uniref:TRAP transporter small permease n=1 Tax=Neotabrizicola sp. sgz301269 TaxID=3276282 RepID=UPI00376F77FA